MPDQLPLNRMATVKLVMTLVGIGVFGAGIRWDQAGVRWAGIAVVAAAWVLRFAKRDRPADADRDETSSAQLPDDTR